jgi:uncharacterized membrane protein YqjE
VSDPEAADSGLSGSARRIGASVLEALNLRLSLFALEFGEEQARLSRLLLTAVAFAVAAMLLFISFNVTLLVVFWDTHRIALVCGMSGFYAALTLALGIWLNRQRRRTRQAFGATREVLERDLQSLRSDS